MGGDRTKRSWQLTGCEDLGKCKHQRLPLGWLDGECQEYDAIKEGTDLNQIDPVKEPCTFQRDFVSHSFWLEFKPIVGLLFTCQQGEGEQIWEVKH